MNGVRHIAGLSLAALAMVSITHADDAATVSAGSVVAIEYTAKLDDGSVAVTTAGGEPVRFSVGVGEILPALETALLGLAVGERKQLSLTPEEAFGAVDPDFFIEVPLEQIPEDLRQVDNMVVGQDEAGRQRYFRIHELGDNTAVLDGNHPLAGQTLHFDIEILSVE